MLPPVTNWLISKKSQVTAPPKLATWSEFIQKSPPGINAFPADFFINIIPRSYNFSRFKRKLLLTTETELSAMAAPAIIGFSRKPKLG